MSIFAKCDYNFYYYYSDTSTSVSLPTEHNDSGTFTSSCVGGHYFIENGKVQLLSPTQIKEKEVLPDKEYGVLVKIPLAFPYNGTGIITNLKSIQGETISFDSNFSFDATSQTYIVSYYFSYSYNTLYQQQIEQLTLTYTFSAVPNRLPLKKWTIADVIIRILYLIEPIREGQSPRFYLRESDKVKLEKIIAPEFSFSKMTLREMLKQVGGFIHGEPRIIKVDNPESDQRRFEVGFDYYGGNELSKISKRAYMSSTFRTDINEYCTALDSSADNLVNQLNWAQGVITEPFINKWEEGAYGRALRTDNVSVRMEENDNTFIPTSLPLYQVGENIKVYCVFINDTVLGNLSGRWDITPYIFEKKAYDNLSSYEGAYPYCKAYALYYEIGQPNIKGLFHKNPDAISPIFQNYAIVNILEQVTGKKLNLIGGDTNRFVFDLQFQIEYSSIYAARVKSNKGFLEKGLKRELAYNQSADLIESQYYGEHLKGTVARLGNVEKTYTYNLAFLSQIPKVGTKFDEHYYISAVNTELRPTFTKCTVALSKDFNRLSQYVGINSIRRMWEVSERQYQKRDSIYTEYVVIGENNNESDINSMFVKRENVAEIMFNKFDISTPVSAITTQQFSKYKEKIGATISLPIVSSSFGNSMTFSAQFKDNYSAGNHIKHITPSGARASAYSVPTEYCDYYGRFYYLYFKLMYGNITAKAADGESGKIITMREYPGVETEGNVIIDTGRYRRIIYRKDNREIPNITYELTAVTDNEDIVIGSELMRNCALVNALPITDLELRLYKTPIPTIGGLPDGEYITGSYSVSGNTLILTLNNSNASQYVSWALCTKSSVKTIQVEDENGIEGEQSIEMGNKLLLGQNKPLEKISSTEYSRKIYFSVKERIYN